MLRSLGIPARVAVGFFVIPESEIMNYYPIRANMAHAWTEVFFPNIGWISFDATTQQLAEGENLNFTMTSGGEEFNSLLSEILENRNGIKFSEIAEDEFKESAATYIKLFLKRHIPLFGILLFVIIVLSVFIYTLFPYLIIKFSKNNRKIILTAGILFYKKKKKNTNTVFIAKMNALIKKAKFAPECSEQDVNEAIFILKTKNKMKDN